MDTGSATPGGQCPDGHHPLDEDVQEVRRFGQPGPVRVIRRRTCCQPPPPPPSPEDLTATADRMWLERQTRLATE